MKKVCMLLMCLLGAAVQGDIVLYYDNFDGAAGTDLNGTTPDISLNAYGAGGGAWAAGVEIDADGKFTYNNSGLGATMRLPFVPQNGQVYTLSMIANAVPSPYRTGTTGYNDWIGMGFVEKPCDPEQRFYDDPSNNNNNPVYWMMSRSNMATQNDQTFTGIETAGGVNSSGMSQDNMKIVLNTQAPIWIVDYYYNDTLARSVNVNDSFKPYFKYIFVSNARADGYVDDFKLSVPEPATLVLLGLGGLTLLKRRHA